MFPDLGSWDWGRLVKSERVKLKRDESYRGAGDIGRTTRNTLHKMHSLHLAEEDIEFSLTTNASHVLYILSFFPLHSIVLLLGVFFS